MNSGIRISTLFPRRDRRLAPLVVALSLAAAGCVVGPDYAAPTVDDDLLWIDGSGPEGALPDEWWRRFEDPALDALVDRALADNLALAGAAERIVQARLAVSAAGAGARPSADLGASVARQRQSETGPLPAGRIPEFPTYQTVYDLGFDARWELDLFGQTQRSVEAREAAFGGAIEARRGLTVSLVAELARRYFEFRGAQAEIAAAGASVAAAERSRFLVERQLAAGSVTRDALARAEAELAIARTRIPPLHARRDSALLALGVLTGTTPEAHQALRDTSRALPTLNPVPVGTPADLLRRRPDVRGAERTLAQATAERGVAEGALYPVLSLGAAAGFTTIASGELLDPASRTWSLAPILGWRVLDDGRLKAQIASAESRQREAAIAYEQAILLALTEAEQALQAYDHARTAIDRQEEAARAVERSRGLVDARYRAGAVPLITFLDAERQASDARAALARAETEGATALVTLYKVLGGGWEAAEIVAGSAPLAAGPAPVERAIEP